MIASKSRPISKIPTKEINNNIKYDNNEYSKLSSTLSAKQKYITIDDTQQKHVTQNTYDDPQLYPLGKKKMNDLMKKSSKNTKAVPICSSIDLLLGFESEKTTINNTNNNPKTPTNAADQIKKLTKYPNTNPFQSTLSPNSVNELLGNSSSLKMMTKSSKLSFGPNKLPKRSAPDIQFDIAKGHKDDKILLQSSGNFSEKISSNQNAINKKMNADCRPISTTPEINSPKNYLNIQDNLPNNNNNNEENMTASKAVDLNQMNMKSKGILTKKRSSAVDGSNIEKKPTQVSINLVDQQFKVNELETLVSLKDQEILNLKQENNEIINLMKNLKRELDELKSVYPDTKPVSSNKQIQRIDLKIYPKHKNPIKYQKLTINSHRNSRARKRSFDSYEKKIVSAGGRAPLLGNKLNIDTYITHPSHSQFSTRGSTFSWDISSAKKQSPASRTFKLDKSHFVSNSSIMSWNMTPHYNLTPSRINDVTFECDKRRLSSQPGISQISNNLASSITPLSPQNRTKMISKVLIENVCKPKTSREHGSVGVWQIGKKKFISQNGSSLRLINTSNSASPERSPINRTNLDEKIQFTILRDSMCTPHNTPIGIMINLLLIFINKRLILYQLNILQNPVDKDDEAKQRQNNLDYLKVYTKKIKEEFNGETSKSDIKTNTILSDNSSNNHKVELKRLIQRFVAILNKYKLNKMDLIHKNQEILNEINKHTNQKTI